MKSFTHNLPVQHTSFVGRESEIAEIVALLDSEYCRLVTLMADSLCAFTGAAGHRRRRPGV